MRLEKKINRLSKRITQVSKNIENLRNWRLLCALAFFIVIVLAVYQSWLLIELVSTVIFLTAFTALWWWHRQNTIYHKALTSSLEFYKRQNLRAQLGKGLTSYKAESHEENQGRDLQLIGEDSVMGLIDECVTIEAQKQLALDLLQASPSLQKINERHKQVSKLLKYQGVCQRLLYLRQKDLINLKPILEFCRKPFAVEQNRTLFLVQIILWIISIVGFASGVFGFKIFWLVYLLITFKTMGLASEGFMKGLSLQTEVSSLRELTSYLEKLSSIKEISNLLPSLKNNSLSKAISSLERALSFLSTQAHPLVHFALNALLPWSSLGVILVSRARHGLSDELEALAKKLPEFEILLSLSTMCKYQTSTLPEVSENLIFSVEEIRHPLMSQSIAVTNNFSFQNPHRLILLTGSNMSGKSTFLRALGVNQVLAMMGAPVFAKKMISFVGPVASCIQVTDSLAQGYSYFYAEVRRLCDVLKLTREKPSLYLVDEIFKGTNNRERFIGSQYIIEALAECSSFGLITTHDLELSTLSQSQEKICNKHFTDQVAANELIFDYKLREGPSQSTNALKIMRLAGLPVP